MWPCPSSRAKPPHLCLLAVGPLPPSSAGLPPSLQEETLPAEGAADQAKPPAALKPAPEPVVTEFLPGKEMFQAPLPVLLTSLVLVGLVVEGCVQALLKKPIRAGHHWKTLLSALKSTILQILILLLPPSEGEKVRL